MEQLKRKSFKVIMFVVMMLFGSISPHLSAQKIYQSWHLDGNVLYVQSDKGVYQLSYLGSQIIKLSFSNERIYGDRLFGALPLDDQLAKVIETESYIRFSYADQAVLIDKHKLSFTYEHNGMVKIEALNFSIKADTLVCAYKMQNKEEIYGTGSRALPLNRRTHRFQCYNQANYGYQMGTEFLNYSIPHIMSSDRYMVLFDNPARAWFDIGKAHADTLSFLSMGGNAAVYFMADNSFNVLMETYAHLTGHQPLVPIWALGHLQSRFGYRSQAQTENIVDSMLAAKYPIDAVILDLYWFGKELQDGEMGNLSWDTIFWPHPEQMISSFKKKGIKTIAISEPYFTRKSKNFVYLDEHKLLGLDSLGQTMTMPYFYFGDAGLLDVFKPEARDWLWDKYATLKKQGVEGWWCDLGEPEVHPDNLRHVNGAAVELHGVYGHEWTSIFYENYLKCYPDERLFVMGRAGFAGSQRYGLIPWTGDVLRSWGGLRAQIPAMLGSGLSGLGYMHSDAGGFAQGERNPELYVRWLQYAAFTPIFRPHSDPNAEPEPIYYDDTIQAILKPLYNLRYQMLPYNYTLAWENHTTGKPLARSLMTVFDEPKFSGNDSSYFWGDNLLVAPVMKPQLSKMFVFLPKGNWFDFWTGEKYAGDREISKALTLEHIPAFVKGGSFIPMVDPIPNTDVYSTKDLVLHFYYDVEVDSSGYTMYMDDGKTRAAYEKGLYELLKINYKRQRIILENEGSDYDCRPECRTLKLYVHNPDFKNVKVQGKRVKLKKETDGLSFLLTMEANARLVIDFKY